MSDCLPPFSAWSGPRRPKCVLVVEAWGENEAKWRKPLVGASGLETFQMLFDAGWGPESGAELAPLLHPRFGDAWINRRGPFLEESGLAITNVLNLRPPNNKLEALCLPKTVLPKDYPLPALAKGQYLDPAYLPELDRLHEELAEASPNLILACGNTACWATLRVTNIGSIRGTISEAEIKCSQWGSQQIKVLPTYHPAGVLRQWSWRPIVLTDMMKARREAEFPEVRRPRRKILHSPTIEEWRAAVENCLQWPYPVLGVDTETSLGMIDTIGFAPSASSGFVCQFRPHRYKRGTNFVTVWPTRDGVPVANYWSLDEEREFWRLNKLLLESSVPKVFQNGLYDLQYLLKMGIAPAALDEDTMLLSHSLFPEMQKGLGFLGSIHTSEPAWKMMSRKADSEKRDE